MSLNFGKSTKKKPVKKGKKKKPKIQEDPKVVRDIISAAERHDNKALLQILQDSVFSTHYDLSETGMAGEALVRACAVGNVVGAHALLEKKAAPNIYNGKALHKACLNYQLDAIKLLMQYNADPNAVSTWANFNALHFAASGGNVAVIKLLVEAGCDLDTTTHPYHCHNENGWTALHLACDRGHLDAVKYLVYKGSKIDIPSAGGETPCSLAAECGYSDIVEFLVAHGADVHAKRRGLSIIQWALYRANIPLIKFLMSYGAIADLDTRVIWFTEDKPPEFGQWDYEVKDEEIVLQDIKARELARIEAEKVLRERVTAQTRYAAAQEFDNDVASQLFESEEQMEEAREAYIVDAINTALSALDDPDMEAMRSGRTTTAGGTIKGVLPPITDDKQGYMTLGQVILRDFSPTIFEKIVSAIYEGKHLLQTRVARQQVLSQLRWTPTREFDPNNLLQSDDGTLTTSDVLAQNTQPTVLALPPQIIHIISSYDM